MFPPWHVEGDGAARAVWIVGTEPQPFAEWLRVGDDQRHRAQRIVEIAGVELAPTLDNRRAQRSPGFAGKAANILNSKHAAPT